MPQASQLEAAVLRFGLFELDVEAGELRRSGRVVKLQPQPFRLLTLLVSRGGAVVSRDEIREQLWGGETFVDFEQGENHCIRQIRTALADDARKPRFVQTVPRRGYRFIAEIESETTLDTPEVPAFASADVEPVAVAETPSVTVAVPASRVSLRRRVAWALSILGLSMLAGLVAARRAEPPHPPPARVLVLPFEDLTRSHGMARGLTYEITTQLVRRGSASLDVVSGLSARSHHAAPPKTRDELVEGLEAHFLLDGSVQIVGRRVRVTVQLVDAHGLIPIWAESYEHPADDLLALQASLAQRIAGEVLRRVPRTEPNGL